MSKDKEQYIQDVKAKNKKLFTARVIKITPESLEAVIRQAYDAGRQSNSGDLFNGLFGGLKSH